MKKMSCIMVLILLLLSGCGGSKSKNDLTGAGATFPLPFYKMSFKQYENQCGTAVAYGGIGSGGGIRSLKDEIVDFAGSDAYLSDNEMETMDSVIHIPTCLGAVVLAYNLPNVTDLNLTGEIVADIFMGKIKQWNDDRIKAVNQNNTLPDLPIIPVYRSDGSGTTFVFSDYLSKVSSSWNSLLGVGKSVNFSTGIAAKGNPGVAGTLYQTQGTIGYIGSEYAFAQKVKIANLKNKAGNYIKPTTESISAAAQGEIPKDSRIMITDSPNENAYSISCFTWILIYKEQNYANRSLEQAKHTISLVKYILSDENQKITTKIHYAPLPKTVRTQALNNLTTVTYNGQAIQ